MKKTVKIALISLIILVTGGFAAFSILYYSGRINTCETVRVIISPEAAVRVYGITPLGREFDFVSMNKNEFYSNPAFYRQVRVTFPRQVSARQYDIIMIIGNKTYTYCVEGDGCFLKPPADRGNINYLKAISSVTRWKVTRNCLYGMAGILVLCLFWLIRIRIKQTCVIFMKKARIFKNNIFHLIIRFLPAIKNNTLNLLSIRIKFSGRFLRQLRDNVRMPGIVAVSGLFILLLVFFISRIHRYQFNDLTALLFVFLVFSGLFLMSYMLFNALRVNNAIRQNIYLLFFIIFLLVTGTEMLLRKVVKKFETYQEKNGMDYVSCYKVGNNSWFFVHHKNNHVITKYPEYTFESHTSSEGISDREFSRIPDSGVSRIITLGDSFTEGFGAPRDSSWPRLLENKLRGAYVRDSFEVMNAGIGGSDICYEYMLLKYRLLKYRPSLVIVALNSSDIPDLVVRGGMERFNKDTTVSYKKAPWWEWIYASSFIFRHIAHDMFGYDFTLIRKNQLTGMEAEATGKIKNCLSFFQALSVRENFRLLVVLHPLHPEESDIVSQENKFGKQMEKSCRQSGIACVNLYDYFTGPLHMNNENHYLYFWKIDSHHNSRSYQAMADGIFAYLKSNCFIIKDNKAADDK